MNSRIPSFKERDVGKKSMLLLWRVYDAARSYPEDERFGLTAGTRKTARSVPANIAEGKMRISVREYRQALGSAGELQTYLIMAGVLRYVPTTTLDSLEADVEEIA